MFDSAQYALLDFGDGRKLERFGKYILDRPCPAADLCRRSDEAMWKRADARFVRTDPQKGQWKLAAALPDTWTVQHGSLAFQLKRTEFGHVGIFAEQAANWDWITRQIREARRSVRVLNLFAYTGGSTLAAASAGAHVVHVDSSRTVVSWARRNARQSGLADSPIRWIVEDARTFVQREQRRGNGYDAVILDPPSYGHGPKGQVWKLNQDLVPLLQSCAVLTRHTRQFMLLTCHSPGYGPAELAAHLGNATFGDCRVTVDGKWLTLPSQDGRRLRSGAVARWPR